MDVLARFHSRQDFHQSTYFAKVMEGIGWSSIPLSEARIAVRQLGPVSLAKMQRSHQVDARKIQRLRQKLCIFRTIIEPATCGEFIDLLGKRHAFSFITPEGEKKAIRLFREAGYKVSPEHYAHTKTAILDLSPSLDTVIATFSSKSRYNVKISQRETTYTTTRFDACVPADKEAFFSLHTRWSTEKNIIGFTNTFLEVVMRSFATRGWLVTARTNGEFSGGMLVLVHDRIAYYFYTCTSEVGKRFHVPSGLAYQAMILAKDQGCDIFDFCSVFDERYPLEHPRWKGFSEFKSRFHPISVQYPPSFSRWL